MLSVCTSVDEKGVNMNDNGVVDDAIALTTAVNDIDTVAFHILDTTLIEVMAVLKSYFLDIRGIYALSK
jgi:hypothetical protein